MWDFLKSGWEWLGGASKAGETPNFMTAFGTLGKVYDGYQQNKMSKKIYGLQKDAYDYNKMLSQRQIDKEDKAQNDLYTAWGNSSYGA